MPQFSFKMQKMAKNSPEVMQHSVIDMRCFWYVDGIKIFILSCTCMLIYVYSSKRLFHCRIRSDSYKINATTTITLYYMRTVFQQWRHSTYRINYMYKVLQKIVLIKPHIWIRLTYIQIHLNDLCFLGNGFVKHGFQIYFCLCR